MVFHFVAALSKPSANSVSVSSWPSTAIYWRCWWSQF